MLAPYGQYTGISPHHLDESYTVFVTILVPFWRQKEGMENMGPSTFGDALHYLAQGDHVARAGWNGKGMYLVQASAGTFLKIDGTPGDLLPFIVMKTADDKFVPWLASQTDMLATDWRLV